MEHVALAREAFAMALADGNRLLIARVGGGLAAILAGAGELDAAESTLAEVAEANAYLGAPRIRGYCERRRAMIRIARGELESAYEHLSNARRILASRKGDYSVTTRSTALLCLDLERYVEAERLAQELLDDPDMRSTTRAHILLSRSLRGQDDWAGVQRVLEADGSTAQRSDEWWIEAGYLAVHHGELDRALALVGNAESGFSASVLTAQVHLAAGRFEDASRWASRARTLHNWTDGLFDERTLSAIEQRLHASPTHGLS